MAAVEITVGEFLYEATVSFTEVVEYGVSLQALSLWHRCATTVWSSVRHSFQRGPGWTPAPAARSTVWTISPCVRTVERSCTFMRGSRPRTARISRSSLTGLFLLKKTHRSGNCGRTSSLITASSPYTWVNQLQGWGIGTVDPTKGEVRVKAYAA